MKDKVLRRIDAIIASNSGHIVIESLDDPAPPALPSIPAPTNLVLSTALARSAVTPTAIISATWDIPDSVNPQSYSVQWSEDPAFPDGATGGFDAPQTSCSIDGLKCNTLYYVRVSATYRSIQSGWSTAASITSADDIVPPAPVTSAAGDFSTGDLLLTWTNPTSANLKDVRVRIYASNGGTLLREAYSSTGRYTWSATNNFLDTAGAPDPSVYIVLTARSYNNIFSTDVTLSSTKAAPVLAGSITSNWDSDTGIAPADLVLNWTGISAIKDYIVTLDGVAHITTDNRFSYSFNTNKQEHSGTADYAISISIVARDTLLQSSNALTLTATNAAPIAPTVTLTGGFSQIVCQVTSAKAGDFDAFEYVWKRDGSTTVRTLESQASEQQYEASATGDVGAHTWTCLVRQKDLFGRYSSTTTSSSITLDNFTIDYLRASAFYSDSEGNTFVSPVGGSLGALKDGNLTSGGPIYLP